MACVSKCCVHNSFINNILVLVVQFSWSKITVTNLHRDNLIHTQTVPFVWSFRKYKYPVNEKNIRSHSYFHNCFLTFQDKNIKSQAHLQNLFTWCWGSDCGWHIQLWRLVHTSLTFGSQARSSGSCLRLRVRGYRAPPRHCSHGRTRGTTGRSMCSPRATQSRCTHGGACNPGHQWSVWRGLFLSTLNLRQQRQH